MDDKFKTLAELVREARIEDQRTLQALEAATSAWKAANKVLTDRITVLNQYTTSKIHEQTAI